MAESNEDNTRGHELYLRHILLLEQAAPVAVKAVLEREVDKHGENLANLISEKKETFMKSHSAEFHQLFQADRVNTNVDSWDISLLYVVTFVLFTSCIASTALEAIKCIHEQRNALDKFAKSVSMTYNAFKENWGPLHSALLHLIEDIPDVSKFKCNQLIYSFDPETNSMRINSELIEKMKQTGDVKLHVQMVTNENVVSQGLEECDDSNRRAQTEENPVFTEKLKDTFVFCDEPTNLTCKLNINDKEVTWRHEYKLVEETEMIMYAKYRHTHCLAIPNAKLKDGGNYSCTCGNASTSAFLTVKEKRLKIVEDLHVATKEADVRENCDIVLTCEVNFHMPKVVWRHNGQEIKQCYKRVASVNGLEYRLIIRNAKFEDEGEYRIDFGDVSSSTKLSIQGNISLLNKMQLANDLYKNWIRGALSLKYLKVGLEEYADYAVKNHQDEILKQLSGIGKLCTRCTSEFLLPSHKQKHCPKRKTCLCSKQPQTRALCPSGGFCSEFYDKLLWDHRFNDLVLENTDVRNWTKDPWSIAACFISTTGYQGKSSAKEVDCSGLLSLFINNMFIHRSLGDVEINGETDLFKQARDARNDILHNANYELSKDQLEDYINLFKDVLEIKDVTGKAPLSGQNGVQEAIVNLEELQRNQIDIYISEDIQKQIKELKEHAMHELAREVEKAEKQNDANIQILEKRLKETETELQLLRDLRTSQTKVKDKTVENVPFELELCMEVIGKTGQTSIEGNQRVYQTIKDYINNQNTKGDISSTEQSIHRILGYITNIRKCKLKDVLNLNDYVTIKFHCFTCKAIGDLLKLINGNEFQKETIVLRKCLEAGDVTTCCSSQSIENTRKRLSKRVRTTDFSCDKHQSMQCTWYCSDDEKFCCSVCKDSDHRACVGLKQVVSDRSYGQQKQSLVLKSKRGEYNVKIKNRRTNRGDNNEDDCYIGSICVLPDGNILVLDYNNKRLKKLDNSYNLVSYCDLPYEPSDLCYIGNDTAVISIWYSCQYVNVSGKMKLLKDVTLGHRCYGMTCHGDTLYVTCPGSVYTYNKDCQQRRVLYRSHDLGWLYLPIAVSDDGEIIYIAGREYGLITIDNKGNHLFTLKTDVLNNKDVCVANDGTVLVSDVSGNVLQVDYRGEHILGQVLSQPVSLYRSSLCYDRKRRRIIVVGDKNNYISVYDLQCPSDVTNVR